GGLNHLVIHLDVVDGDSRNRPVERQQGQGAGGEILPLAAVTSLGGIDHAALHGAIPFDPGHYDPHQPILSPWPVQGARPSPAAHDGVWLEGRRAGGRAATRARRHQPGGAVPAPPAGPDARCQDPAAARPVRRAACRAVTAASAATRAVSALVWARLSSPKAMQSNATWASCAAAS